MDLVASSKEQQQKVSPKDTQVSDLFNIGLVNHDQDRI